MNRGIEIISSNDEITIKEEPYDDDDDYYYENHSSIEGTAMPGIKIEDIEIEQDNMFCENNSTQMDIGIEIKQEVKQEPDEEIVDYGDATVPATISKPSNQTSTQVDTAKKNWRCDVCDKVFRLQRSLTIHKNFNMCANRNECNICKEVFSDLQALKIHKETSHQITLKFFCTSCKISFLCSKDLAAHNEANSCVKILNKVLSPENSHVCLICDLKFRDERDLNDHMILCDKSLRKPDKLSYTVGFKCKFCDDIYNTRQEVFMHCKTKHVKRRLRKKSLASLRKRPFYCRVCDIPLQSQTSLLLHNIKLHRSFIPGTTLPNRNALLPSTSAGVRPIQAENSMSISIPHHNTLFPCDRCNNSFETARGLVGHKNVKHNAKKASTLNKCTRCNLKFSSLRQLKKHDETALCLKNTLRFVCVACHNRFIHASALATHMERFHGDDLPFHCNVCNNKFRTIKEMQDHESQHISLTSYICHICDENFRDMNDLRTHILEHNSTPPSTYKKKPSSRGKVAK